jgi:hypothetical protein
MEELGIVFETEKKKNGWKYEIKLEKEPQTKVMTLKVKQEGESVWYFTIEFSQPDTQVIIGDDKYTTEEDLGLMFGLRKEREYLPDDMFDADIKYRIEPSGSIIIPQFFKLIETPRYLARVCVTNTNDNKLYRFLCYKGTKKSLASSCIDYEHPLIKLKAID